MVCGRSTLTPDWLRARREDATRRATTLINGSFGTIMAED
jgi:hypothetical protein